MRRLRRLKFSPLSEWFGVRNLSGYGLYPKSWEGWALTFGILLLVALFCIWAQPLNRPLRFS